MQDFVLSDPIQLFEKDTNDLREVCFVEGMVISATTYCSLYLSKKKFSIIPSIDFYF